MIPWILSTLVTAIAAILIAGPIIWRYAIRHAAAMLEAKAGAVPGRPAETSTSPNPANADRPPWIWGAVAGGIVLLVGAGIYASREPSISGDTSILGPKPTTPQLAPLPGSSQFFQETTSTDRALDQLQQFASGSAGTQAPAKTNAGLPPVDELIQRLATRLQKNPNDIAGWRTLGWANFNIQHYDDAAAAYAMAIKLYPNVADLYSARGEALVQAANGTLTPEAKKAFSEALKLDATDLRGRFYNGLEKLQAGDKAAALDIWIDVANDAGPNEPMVPTVRQRIAELAKELNVDVNKRLHKPVEAAIAMLPSQAKSPTAAVAPARASPVAGAKPEAAQPPAEPADQSAMIGAMVKRLEARLEKSPRDVDGWIMLIRSKQVLNDPNAAHEAFARALKVFETNSPEHDRLIAGAKGLGLTP
jgi:cytochrome c-type biogenesis protein CcmH